VARLRIALFATPSRYGEQTLAHLARTHDVVSLVTPAPRGGGLAIARRILGAASPSRLERQARELGVPTLRYGGGEDEPLRDHLEALRAELCCIALFPWRVDTNLTAVAPLGAVNAHPSLLPRHRGPLPLFWTYHADDRRAGVTVHVAADRLDAGDVILQDDFELPRAHPVAALDAAVAERAGPLLARAADALAHGTARREAQDESRATYAPVIRRGQPMVDSASWDAERVWHFLAALAPGYVEPLVDERGRAVPYARVDGWDAEQPKRAPGTVASDGAGWRLQCRDGTVRLSPGPR
jgi:methionyl-tRNA formyltransferase